VLQPAEPEVYQWGLEPQLHRTPSNLRHGTASHSLSHSGESTHHYRHRHHPRPAAARAPQQGCPEPMGSQAPQSLSQKAPPHEIRARVSRVVTHVTAVGSHPKVVTDQ
jgi:hypothetical protein